MNASTQVYTNEQIYSAFKETFYGFDPETLDVNSSTLLSVWPYLKQLCDSDNMVNDMANWSNVDRDAFMNAYNGHYPIDSGNKMFKKMNFQSSFIASILFMLHH